jgi:hypothetical protein
VWHSVCTCGPLKSKGKYDNNLIFMNRIEEKRIEIYQSLIPSDARLIVFNNVLQTQNIKFAILNKINC